MPPVHPQIHLLHPFLKILSLKQDEQDPILDSTTESMSGLTTPVIIGISVGATLVVILLISLAVYCYCRSPSRPNTTDALYYKFDYNSSSLATLEKDAQTLKHNTSSTSDRSSRPPSSLYLTDDFSIPFDSQYSNKHNSSSKSNRNRSGRTNSSYASMDDGISAPRTLESEVPSSKVAFLDEHGRPITTPL